MRRGGRQPVRLEVNETMFTSTKPGRVSHVLLFRAVYAKGGRGRTEAIEVEGANEQAAGEALTEWFDDPSIVKVLVDDISKPRPVPVERP